MSEASKFQNNKLKITYLKFVFLFVFSFFLFNLFGRDTVIIVSQNLPVNDTILIFQPSKKSSVVDKYALVILLHGLNGNYLTWANYTDLRLLANQYQCIFACPDGLKDSYYLNNPVDTTMDFNAFFTEELIPLLLEKYSIDPSKIFITGNSMGGHGAISLFLNNPNLFSAAGSISGIFDLSYSSSRDNRLSELLGNYAENKHSFDENSVIFMIDNIDLKNKNLIVHCGTEDHFYELNKNFVKKCISKDANIYYNFSPGKHDKIFWRKAIIKQLNTYFKKIN